MVPIARRTFLEGIAGTAALAALTTDRAVAQAAVTRQPVFLSTWAHGKPANDQAAAVFAAGGGLLDAIEKGINVPEDDPNVTSVGYGGPAQCRRGG